MLQLGSLVDPWIADPFGHATIQHYLAPNKDREFVFNITSRGGDPFTVISICKSLTGFSKVVAQVPHFTYSFSALLVLCADEIQLSPHACLSSFIDLREKETNLKNIRKCLSWKWNQEEVEEIMQVFTAERGTQLFYEDLPECVKARCVIKNFADTFVCSSSVPEAVTQIDYTRVALAGLTVLGLSTLLWKWLHRKSE